METFEQSTFYIGYLIEKALAEHFRISGKDITERYASDNHIRITFKDTISLGSSDDMNDFDGFGTYDVDLSEGTVNLSFKAKNGMEMNDLPQPQSLLKAVDEILNSYETSIF
jgi:hypothetical protein